MEIRRGRGYVEPMKPARKLVELHPSEWEKDWRPPIGNDPIPGEKPHIWQEFKRDMHMRRDAGQPVIGVGWPILAAIFAGFLVSVLFRLEGGPGWVLAIRSLF